MNDSQIDSIKEIVGFLNSNRKVEFKAESKEETYQWIQKKLVKLRYHFRGRKDKGIIKEYLEKITGYSRSQITRLVRKHKKTGYVKREKYKKSKFPRTYLSSDIRLLAETDDLHDFPNGAALKANLRRMWKVYKDKSFKRVWQISVPYIYHLRRKESYRVYARRYQKTKPSSVNIGTRQKPQPEGKPGYIRVDSVHQGDQNGKKGVYHVNMVDEVTQWQQVGAVAKLTREHMLPLLEKLITKFPFKIIQFHADNGSEFINHEVAEMLNEEYITLTKNRARRPNDNALVESKNGSVVRKWLGYSFIRQKYADRINQFYFGSFNEYLNFHRACGFATKVKDKRGKVKKIYKYEDYMTPYEKLKSLPSAKEYLREEITFAELDKIELKRTDNEMAQIVQKERRKLIDEIV